MHTNPAIVSSRLVFMETAYIPTGGDKSVCRTTAFAIAQDKRQFMCGIRPRRESVQPSAALQPYAQLLCSLGQSLSGGQVFSNLHDPFGDL